MPTETKSDLLTEKELARELRVSTKTISNWREAGILPHFRHGYVIRYRLNEVLEALQRK